MGTGLSLSPVFFVPISGNYSVPHLSVTPDFIPVPGRRFLEPDLSLAPTMRCLKNSLIWGQA